MILGLVAPFSQSMSSFRATATHFVPKTMNFVRPQSLKHINGTYKILILDQRMYCKDKIYVLQIQKYGIKAPIIYCKYRSYVF